MYGGRECDVCGNRVDEELMEQMRNTFSDSMDVIYSDIICPDCAVELDDENWEGMWEHFREEAERQWEQEQQDAEYFGLETPKQSSSGSVTKSMGAEVNMSLMADRREYKGVTEWQRSRSQEELINTIKSATLALAIGGFGAVIGYYVAPKMFKDWVKE